MTKALTDSVVSSLKPQRSQVGWRELADGATRGLCIRISPRGETVWAVRHVVGGKRSRHTIGAYPTVSLAEARKRAGDYLSGTRDGMSPEEVDARTQALTMTLKQAHAAYLESVTVSTRASTRALKETMFRTHIEPAIGTRMIRTVRRADVVEVVSQVARKGYPVQANRVFSELMALLRWCEQMSYLDGVPSIRKKDLRNFGAAKEQPRRRALSDTEVAEVWQISAGLGATSRDFLRLLLLTGQRRDEVRLMSWEEIDMDAAMWVIPAARYKTGIDHAVPLSAAVMDILRTCRHQGASGYVLPGRREGQPFNGTLSALRRLRKGMANRQPFTLHDFRRTVRTGLSRLKVDPTTSELVIGHVPQGMNKVYDVHERLDERRRALEKWGAPSSHRVKLLLVPERGGRRRVALTLAWASIGELNIVVTPAQKLMTVVPKGAVMEVEAKLPNKDIGFVEPGQDADVKVDAFPFTKYGTLAPAASRGESRFCPLQTMPRWSV